jgi:hypothetical protein
MNIKTLFSICLISLCLFSCKKNPEPTPGPVVVPVVPVSPHVYTVGTNLIGSNLVAVMYKDSFRYRLTKGDTLSSAKAIAIKGTDIYIAGTVEIGGILRSAYWKNGQIRILDAGTALDIAIDGNDVYVAGGVGGRYAYEQRGAYWKNGVLAKLVNPIERSSAELEPFQATAIAAKNGAVHIVGNITLRKDIALYWKNGIGQTLTFYSDQVPNLCSSSKANDITLDGNDVYIAGDIIPADINVAAPNEPPGVVYWKNGTIVQLSGNQLYSQGRSLAVSNGVVYFAGALGPNAKAVYWSASQQLFFDAGFNLHRMRVFQEDVYIAAETTINGWPCYMKNQQVIALSQATTGEMSDIEIAAP